MNPNLIYDVGMNDGNDTAFYLACGFRVVSVEADPDLVAAATKRFQHEIESKRLTILNVGIAEQNTQADFWINEVGPHLNSFSREAATRFGHPAHCISISCRRLDDILSEFGVPFYLKIDIEGHDIICCRQIAAVDKPKYISVEMTQMELLEALQKLGYDRFKLITQLDLRAVDPKPIPLSLHMMRRLHRAANFQLNDSRLSLRIRRALAANALRLMTRAGFKMWGATDPFKSRLVPEWSFVEGCSGTFGEDLPGAWLDAEQTAQLWQRDDAEYRRMGREFWCDLHATESSKSRSCLGG